jgi:sigma-E factor negative regulatory protein RseA
METLKPLHELISAMADGALAAHEAELALAALTEPEGRAAWQAYQLIGDALRSDASGAELSDGFSARLAARLDVEVSPSPPPAPAPGRAAPAPASEPAPAGVHGAAPALAQPAAASPAQALATGAASAPALAPAPASSQAPAASPALAAAVPDTAV